MHTFLFWVGIVTVIVACVVLPSLSTWLSVKSKQKRPSARERREMIKSAKAAEQSIEHRRQLQLVSGGRQR